MYTYVQAIPMVQPLRQGLRQDRRRQGCPWGARQLQVSIKIALSYPHVSYFKKKNVRKLPHSMFYDIVNIYMIFLLKLVFVKTCFFA